MTSEQKEWTEAHLRAFDRFVAEQDNLETFTANLEAIGFVEPDLSSELKHAIAERSEASLARFKRSIANGKS